MSRTGQKRAARTVDFPARVFAARKRCAWIAYYVGNIAMRFSGIRTKAPCAAALKNERHVRMEISDFVMRTFSPRFPRAAAAMLNVFVAIRVG